MSSNIKFEMETIREIWSDADKTCVEIGPDRDGIHCVEIRWLDEKHKIVDRMSFMPDMARLIATALLKCADEMSGPKTSILGKI
jgi:hypothetical protein